MDAEEVIAVLIVFASLTTVVLTFAAMWFKHAERKAKAQLQPGALDARLERIEQAVDAIAVEVERLAEGQRFATRLLSEGAAPAQAVRAAAAGAGVEPRSPH
ncbi:MAG: hypothetical protein ACT4R6_01400 [Gemmatimonadaceae bacterium]